MSCNGRTGDIIPTFEDGQGITRFRKIPCSDREKESMSETLIKQVSKQSVFALLAEMDGVWDGTLVDRENQIHVQRGPFGLFNVIDQVTEEVSSPDVSAFINDFVTSRGDITATDTLDLQVVVANGDVSWLDDAEEIEISNFLGAQDTPVATIASPALLLNRTNATSCWSRDTTSQHRDAGLLRDSSHLLSSANVSRGLPGTDLMRDAPALLRYYAEIVIPLMTPFKHGKTPWHVLFLPVAKDTLASITMSASPDDASLCAFYGILSLSACHLQVGKHRQRWLDHAGMFKELAQQCVGRLQVRAYNQPKAFKYKTVVVAFLTIAQLSAAEGQWEQTKQCLLDTERFIRSRGLTKTQKSRKVRLLHHCYAYMRIFHESLSRSLLPPGQGSATNGLVKDITETVPGQDCPSFRLTAWEDLDEKLREIKSREQGENDLHLSIPGLWNSTLYPEIWGVPESWMILLSQTIRLGNEKEVAASSDTGDVLSLREFSRRAKVLEQCILRWEDTTQNDIKHSGCGRQNVGPKTDQVLLTSTMNALHHGLIIYFYRRVYNLDACLLQRQVTHVRNSLFLCKGDLQSGSKYLAGLVWPAFVAACEAVDVVLQKSFLGWFTLCAKHNAQLSLTRMHEIVKSVWVHRQHSRNAFRDAPDP